MFYDAPDVLTHSKQQFWPLSWAAEEAIFIKMLWSSSWKWIWKWPAIIHHQKCPLLNGPVWEQFLIEDLFSSYKAAAWNTVTQWSKISFWKYVVVGKSDWSTMVFFNLVSDNWNVSNIRRDFQFWYGDLLSSLEDIFALVFQKTTLDNALTAIWPGPLCCVILLCT